MDSILRPCLCVPSALFPSDFRSETLCALRFWLLLRAVAVSLNSNFPHCLDLDNAALYRNVANAIDSVLLYIQYMSFK
jgi:hypothetical protein